MKLQSITRTLSRQLLITKKNSPHIFFAGGVVGIIGSTVLACRATLKLDKTLDEIKNDITTVKELHEHPDENSEYPQQAYSRDMAYVYTKSARRLIVLYGPTVVVGTASIAALTGSHMQLTRRNAALTTTLTAVSQAFNEYRLRVSDELGEDRELEIYHGVKEEKEGKETVKVISLKHGSPYARFFDETSSCFKKDPEYNRIFLECQQQYANDILRAKGHIFLNEVYDCLDLSRTPAGQIVGWIWQGDGDNYVDFGIYDKANSRFINGLERVVRLDFNVDGPIYENI